MPQTTRWRFCEFTAGHYTMRGRRVKWFAAASKNYFAFSGMSISTDAWLGPGPKAN